MHRIATLNRRVPHGALVMLERSAGKLARSVLRGEGSREAPDLPGASHETGFTPYNEIKDLRRCFIAGRDLEGFS